VSVAAVLSPAEYESRLQRYLFERSEEGRAVRVGEKEVSERAEIVRRYADLFTREQLEGLREAEGKATEGEDRERLYRLRKTCEAGLIAAATSSGRSPPTPRRPSTTSGSRSSARARSSRRRSAESTIPSRARRRRR